MSKACPRQNQSAGIPTAKTPSSAGRWKTSVSVQFQKSPGKPYRKKIWLLPQLSMKVSSKNTLCAELMQARGAERCREFKGK